MVSLLSSLESHTAEPPRVGMKSHSAMNHAIARLLSDDQLKVTCVVRYSLLATVYSNFLE